MKRSAALHRELETNGSCSEDYNPLWVMVQDMILNESHKYFFKSE
jgi:hypothetical protein